MMVGEIDAILKLSDAELRQALGKAIFGPINTMAEKHESDPKTIEEHYDAEFMDYKKYVITTTLPGENKTAKGIALVKKFDQTFTDGFFKRRGKRNIFVPDTISSKSHFIIIAEKESTVNIGSINTGAYSPFHTTIELGMPKPEIYIFRTQYNFDSPRFSVKSDGRFEDYQILKNNQYYTIWDPERFDYKENNNLVFDRKGTLTKCRFQPSGVFNAPQFINFGENNSNEFMSISLAYDIPRSEKKPLRNKCKTYLSCIPAENILKNIVEKK